MEAAENSNDASAIDEALFTSGHFEGGENADDSAQDDTDRGDSEPLKEQDRFLPIANISRIMKKCVPQNGKIAKEAKDCVQECVSEFVSFITSEASERCQQEKRKTLNGEDILFAMATLGFDNYVEPLKMYLQKFRESTKGDKSISATYIEANMKDIGMSADESFGNILTGDQHFIYTTSFAPAQVTTQSPLNFG